MIIQTFTFLSLSIFPATFITCPSRIVTVYSVNLNGITKKTTKVELKYSFHTVREQFIIDTKTNLMIKAESCWMSFSSQTLVRLRLLSSFFSALWTLPICYLHFTDPSNPFVSSAGTPNWRIA